MSKMKNFSNYLFFKIIEYQSKSCLIYFYIFKRLFYFFWAPFLCTQKVSTLLKSVSVSVRPSVYSITLHNYIRFSWNFVHRIVSSISRSSSKMRRIRQEMAELSKKLSFLTRPSLRGHSGIFSKKYFSQNYPQHM